MKLKKIKLICKLDIKSIENYMETRNIENDIKIKIKAYIENYHKNNINQ